MVLEAKINAIDLIIKQKITTEDDISGFIGKLSI